MTMSTATMRVMRWLVPALLVLMSGCATVGSGAYPGSDYPGNGYPGSGYPDTGTPGYGQRQDIQGQVQNVDHRNRRFLLTDDRGMRADVVYDDRTRLVYRGQQQAVDGLEPGDRIRVLASREGGLWRADDIEVIQDVRGGGTGMPMEPRGAVTFVDTRARLIGFTEGGYTGSDRRVSFDSRTVVEYRGRSYRPDALERGDLVRFQLRRGDGGWIADRILVEVSARDR